MIRRFGAIALLALPLFGIAQTAGAQPADPPQVNVRVEGIHKTLFEGFVNATIHKVDGHDGTGKHKCNGTNGGASKTPVRTFTAAFDSAMRLSKTGWLGNWSDQFQDFLISRVGPDSSTTTKFWNLDRYNRKTHAWEDLQVGGCQQKVKEGDKLLIAYNAFGKVLLKLSGPKHTHSGKAFKVKVVNGRNGDPVQGAKVRGHKTNAKGIVKLTVKNPGVTRLKARKSGTIRSNSLFVSVQP
jgi:hypothetical protein